MITPAQRAEIRRLYYGEHWKLGTIAAELGLHRETVRAAVEREPGAGRPGLYRPSALDPYLPFIRDTLAQVPPPPRHPHPRDGPPARLSRFGQPTPTHRQAPAARDRPDRLPSLRPHATRLLALLDDYGPQELAAAVDDALQRDALGAGSITHILETRRRQRGLKPPLRLTLPDRPGLRDLDVRPHDLETYDAIGRNTPDDAAD